MTAEATHVRQAQQLARLRGLREQQAQRALATAEHAQRLALAAMQARQAELAQRRLARSELLARCTAPAAWILRCVPYSSAMLDLLDEAVERCEVALAEDEEALQAARERCDEARAAWRQAHARGEAAGEVLGHASRAWARSIEQRQQRDEALPRPSIDHRGAPA